MQINEDKLRKFVEKRFDDVLDDYNALHLFCYIIIKANEQLKSGDAIAALTTIKDCNILALEQNSHIEESLIDDCSLEEIVKLFDKH